MIFVHQEDDHLIRVRLQSHHTSSRTYLLWIEYRLRGGGGGWAPYQGSVYDPLGTLSGPQTPRLLTPPPLTTNPGSAPGWHCRMSAEHRQHPHNQSRHILMKN
jgi:hypothetical protein